MTSEATTLQVDNNNNDSVATTTLVVGEHSVYKSVDDLIKGKREADEYIAKLTQDLKEAEATIEDLKKKTTIADQLKQIRETKMEPENTNTQLPEDAMKQIALNAMQEYNKKNEADNNLLKCKEAVSTIASDVNLALKNKAQELGCTVEYLEDIAKTSPKAFKSMFGIKETVSFDSVNFLQGARHADTTGSDEASAFFKDQANWKNPTKVGEFMKKAMQDPSILNNIKW